MAVSATTGAILIAYVLTMGFLFWFCVIADPAKSPTVHFVTYTIPVKMYEILDRFCGPGAVQLVSALADRALALIYLAVVLGSFSILWWFVYPWVDRSEHVENYHKMIGYALVFWALYTWRLAMITRLVRKDTCIFYVL